VLQLLALLVAGVLAAALVGFYSDNLASIVPGRCTALYAIVFRQVSVWRATWFTLILLPEFLIFLFALEWLGYGDSGHISRARHWRD
jgi:hypothetical protein